MHALVRVLPAFDSRFVTIYVGEHQFSNVRRRIADNVKTTMAAILACHISSGISNDFLRVDVYNREIARMSRLRKPDLVAIFESWLQQCI